MLNGIEQTSSETIELVIQIKNLMQKFKHDLRTNLPKLYSQDLLNSIFKHPYTKIEYLQHDLNIDRKTAGKYLNLLAEHNFMHKEKVGNYNYYLNVELLKLFT